MITSIQSRYLSKYDFSVLVKAREGSASKVIDMNFQLCDHSLLRSKQRGIEIDSIAFTLTHGEMIQKHGRVFCVIKRRHISKEQICKQAKYLNTVVILNKEQDKIITTYKSKDAMRVVNKKRKYQKNKSI
jgi:hypothetical protein